MLLALLYIVVFGLAVVAFSRPKFPHDGKIRPLVYWSNV